MGTMRFNVLVRNQKIKDHYDKESRNGKKNIDAIINDISSKHKIGKFYIRSILKEQGVDIKRKTNYDRKNSSSLEERNKKIKEMFSAEISIEHIAEKFNLTETRVRQITKGLIIKEIDFTSIIKEINLMIESGSTYENIVDRYGKETIKKLKIKAGFNVYQKALKRQNNLIVEMFKSGKTPLEISQHFYLNRDSVYIILKKQILTSRI